MYFDTPVAGQRDGGCDTLTPLEGIRSITPIRPTEQLFASVVAKWSTTQVQTVLVQLRSKTSTQNVLVRLACPQKKSCTVTFRTQPALVTTARCSVDLCVCMCNVTCFGELVIFRKCNVNAMIDVGYQHTSALCLKARPGPGLSEIVSKREYRVGSHTTHT